MGNFFSVEAIPVNDTSFEIIQPLEISNTKNAACNTDNCDTASMTSVVSPAPRDKPPAASASNIYTNLTSAAGNLTCATHATCGSVEAGNTTSATGAALVSKKNNFRETPDFPQCGNLPNSTTDSNTYIHYIYQLIIDVYFVY